MSNKSRAQGSSCEQPGRIVLSRLPEAFLVRALLAVATWPSVLASGLRCGLQHCIFLFKAQSPSGLCRGFFLTSHPGQRPALLRPLAWPGVLSERSHLCVFATSSCHLQGPAQVSPSRNVPRAAPGPPGRALFPNAVVPCPPAASLQALRE